MDILKAIATGDALGYYKGNIEFETNPLAIYEIFHNLGGIMNVKINPNEDWIVSDDTVQSIAIANGIKDNYYKSVCDIAQACSEELVKCDEDMVDRAPGSRHFVKSLQNKGSYKNIKLYIKFYVTGCGSIMRSPIIGSLYRHDYKKMMCLACECGKITHNNPSGVISSIIGSLFTYFGYNNIDKAKWGEMLMEKQLEITNLFFENNTFSVNEINECNEIISFYFNTWSHYLQTAIHDLSDIQTMNENYRTIFHLRTKNIVSSKLPYNFGHGWDGLSAGIIAYDAIMCSTTYEHVCWRSICHGGDSDSTGCIALAWWCSIHSTSVIPDIHYQFSEKKNEIDYLMSLKLT